ncbi:unnamed protein product [Orchesella dallaii]|uniref:Uncharacterized protein n=1 Tax=Orchesella dallaii TaxID=48710 RepID=A0ABP1RJS7_9HEXA
MGFGVAYINVLLLHQQIFESPVSYDVTKGKPVANPKAKNPFQLPIWRLVEVCVFATHLFGMYRCIYMIDQYTSYHVVNPEAAFLYVFVTSTTTQALVTMFTVDRDPETFASVVNQTMTAGRVRYQGWPNSKRLPDIKELSAYVLAAAFFHFPLINALYPLLRSYDPINILLENGLSELPRRLLASLIYGIVVFYAANICAALILMMLTCVETLQIETEKNYRLSTGKSEGYKISRIERITNAILKAAFVWIEHNLTRVQRKVPPRTPMCRTVHKLMSQR